MLALEIVVTVLGASLLLWGIGFVVVIVHDLLAPPAGAGRFWMSGD
jgi:hypothetical protein